MASSIAQKTPAKGHADRVLGVLSLFRGAQRDLGVTEISAALQLDKSVVHRILKSLVSHGYLQRDADTRRYRVGLQAWKVGQRYSAAADITQAAIPPLRALLNETGGTGYVAKLEGLDIVYLAVVEMSGPLSIRVEAEVGTRVTAHTTAVGKALLACLPERELLALLERDGSKLPTRTAASIASVEQLLGDLEDVRETQYALNRGEHVQGMGSVGVAVRDASGSPLAGVSVAFPMFESYRSMWTILPGKLTALVGEIDARLRAQTLGAHAATDVEPPA
jgi:DNA-binding IclR family transcriptional regulator